MEGVFCFKSWFLNAPGLIHCGAYYRNFTVYSMSDLSQVHILCLKEKRQSNVRSADCSVACTLYTILLMQIFFRSIPLWGLKSLLG